MAVSIHDPVNIPAAEETTTVVQVSQWASLGGLTVDEALAASTDLDPVRLVTVPAGARCPWGHTWYRANEDGILECFQANWDSSG
jgi:hypothetical protein